MEKIIAPTKEQCDKLKIPIQIMSLYGVKTSPGKVFFPYGTDVTKVVGDDVEWLPSPSTELFGMQTCKTTDTLLVCEDEWDTIAAYAMTGLDSVGIPTENIQDALRLNVSWLFRYKRIVLLFDGGKIARKILGFRLAQARLVDYGGIDNPYEYNLNGLVKEFKDIIESALVQVSDFDWTKPELESEMLSHIGKSEGKPISTGFNNLDSLCVFRMYEWTLLLGSPGRGKSTLARDFLHKVSLQGELPYYISFEESVPEQILKLVPLMLGESIHYSDTGDVTNTMDDILSKTNRVHEKVILSKVRADIDEVCKAIECAHIMYGCRFFVIDHITWLLDLSDDPVSDIRKYLHKICDVVKRFPIHILVVSHNKRSQEPSKAQYKNSHQIPSDWEEYEEPTQRDAIFGSSFEQLAFNIWAMKNPDDPKQPVRIHVLKNRKRGKRGKVFLYYDELSGSFSEVKYGRQECPQGLSDNRWSEDTLRFRDRTESNGEVLSVDSTEQDQVQSIPPQKIVQYECDKPSEGGGKGTNGRDATGTEDDAVVSVDARLPDTKRNFDRGKGNDGEQIPHTRKNFSPSASSTILKLSDSLSELQAESS